MILTIGNHHTPDTQGPQKGKSKETREGVEVEFLAKEHKANVAHRILIGLMSQNGTFLVIILTGRVRRVNSRQDDFFFGDGVLLGFGIRHDDVITTMT